MRPFWRGTGLSLAAAPGARCLTAPWIEEHAPRHRRAPGHRCARCHRRPL